MQPPGMLFLPHCTDPGQECPSLDTAGSAPQHPLPTTEDQEPHSHGRAEAWPSLQQGDQSRRWGLAVIGKGRQEPPVPARAPVQTQWERRAVSAPDGEVSRLAGLSPVDHLHGSQGGRGCICRPTSSVRDRMNRAHKPSRNYHLT